MLVKLQLTSGDEVIVDITDDSIEALADRTRRMSGFIVARSPKEKTKKGNIVWGDLYLINMANVEKVYEVVEEASGD